MDEHGERNNDTPGSPFYLNDYEYHPNNLNFWFSPPSSPLSFLSAALPPQFPQEPYVHPPPLQQPLMISNDIQDPINLYTYLLSNSDDPPSPSQLEHQRDQELYLPPAPSFPKHSQQTLLFDQGPSSFPRRTTSTLYSLYQPPPPSFPNLSLLNHPPPHLSKQTPFTSDSFYQPRPPPSPNSTFLNHPSLQYNTQTPSTSNLYDQSPQPPMLRTSCLGLKPRAFTSSSSDNAQFNSGFYNPMKYTFGSPFPWAHKYKQTEIFSLQHLKENGFNKISGRVRCGGSGKGHLHEFDLEEEYKKVSKFIVDNIHNVRSGGPMDCWSSEIHHNCDHCKKEECRIEPAIPFSLQKINWLFLFLGQMLGFCKTYQLEYFCDRNRNRMAAIPNEQRKNKNHLLSSAYLVLCKQLDPTFLSDV